MRGSFNIIRPVGLKPTPDKYEEEIAEICAKWFQSDVAFVLRSGHTTPDLQIVKTRQCWEIKNIKGSLKHAVENNLRRASKQSENVIISLLKPSKLESKRVELKLRYILRTQHIGVKRVLLITKSKKVIDIK